jgi:hypothetical protein
VIDRLDLLRPLLANVLAGLLGVVLNTKQLTLVKLSIHLGLICGGPLSHNTKVFSPPVNVVKL